MPAILCGKIKLAPHCVYGTYCGVQQHKNKLSRNVPTTQIVQILGREVDPTIQFSESLSSTSIMFHLAGFEPSLYHCLARVTSVPFNSCRPSFHCWTTTTKTIYDDNCCIVRYCPPNSRGHIPKVWRQRRLRR